MRSSVVKFVIAAAVTLAAQGSSHAATLQVEPVLIDVTAPGAASTVTLRNEGAAPINVQIRVFRWSQVDGKENLEPTDEVVASPPAVTLAPKGNYVARVVRVSKRPISGEESYRVLIDQLPAPRQQRGNASNCWCATPSRSSSAHPNAAIRRWHGRRCQRQQDQSHRPQRWRPAGTNRLAEHSRCERKDRVFRQGTCRLCPGKINCRMDSPCRRLCRDGAISVSAQSDTGPVEAVASISSGR